MEIVLVIFIILIIGGLIIVKQRFSAYRKLQMSIFAGLPLIIWSWLIVDAPIYPKVIITAVVLSYIFNITKAFFQNKKLSKINPTST
jgi:phosphatidylserine synthase